MAATREQIEELKKEIPYKYRVQQMKFDKAQLVAYVDARDVQDLLDEAVGPENWQDKYEVIDDNLYCSIGINTENSGFIWKTDCGTESNIEKEKGQSSDAFKRAAVKWGVGRFLYRLEIEELPTKKHTNNKEYPATREGKILWNGTELTEYVVSVIERRKNPMPAGKLNLRLVKDPGDDKKVEPAKKTEARSGYKKSDGAPAYSNPTIPWSKPVMDRATKVEKNGKTGSVCLESFIPEYNKNKSTTYKEVLDFNTDDKLLDLITFVEESIPVGM
jgi:hypothetical protein